MSKNGEAPELTKEQKNLLLWNAVSTTDPDRTKPFERGNFKGTSTSPLYVINKVTAQWGPVGMDWGYKEVDRVVDPKTGLWFAKVLVWYKKSLIRENEEGIAEITHWGGDTYSSVGANGVHFNPDDDAPKKALTDGLMKALTLLGFCADVHMGLHDNDKYVANVRMEKAAHQAQLQKKPPQTLSDLEEEPQEPALGPCSDPNTTFFEKSEPPSIVPTAQVTLPVVDGVSYQTYTDSTGVSYWEALGATYEKKDFIKAAGFKWSRNLDKWLLPQNQAALSPPTQ